jgi:hypothetical protein
MGQRYTKTACIHILTHNQVLRLLGSNNLTNFLRAQLTCEYMIHRCGNLSHGEHLRTTFADTTGSQFSYYTATYSTEMRCIMKDLNHCGSMDACLPGIFFLSREHTPIVNSSRYKYMPG